MAEVSPREEWLARLDHFLAVTRPIDTMEIGPLELYAALPALPLVGVDAASLPGLLDRRRLTPPAEYAQLVELHPSELGTDGRARYYLRDPRDPRGDHDDDRPPSDRPDTGRDDGGPGSGVVPAPAPRRADRVDGLDRLDRRISEARRARRAVSNAMPVDFLRLVALDGYCFGLESARLCLSADLARRSLIR